MNPNDERYFETKNELDILTAENQPITEDLLWECEQHGVVVPAGVRVQGFDDGEVPEDTSCGDEVYNDGNPFGFLKGGAI